MPRPSVETRCDARSCQRTQMFLLREGILDEKGINQLEKEVEAELQVAVDRALEALPPVPESITNFVYSPDIDPTSAAFDTQPIAPEAPADGKKIPAKTMADLITATLRDEMKRDERIMIFGEDVADCSREEYLKRKLVKGKGGVFKLTFGLQYEFGNDRVFNSPAGRSGHRGSRDRHGHARAEAGGRDSVLRLHLARHDADSRRTQRHPLALEQWILLPGRDSRGDWRISDRRRHLSLAMRRERLHAHSGLARRVSVELTRTPLDCCAPRSAATIRCCSSSTSGSIAKRFGRAPYPGPDYMIPFGKAKIVHPGTDLTVITYGAVVPRALQAAQKIEREQGVKVELIDLRCLNPFDWETIAASVAKTNRVLVAYEDTLSWGYGAEIAARIADQLFDHLDAPVRRVAAKDVFVAYQPILEDAILPQPNDLFLAMKELAEY